MSGLRGQKGKVQEEELFNTTPFVIITMEKINKATVDPRNLSPDMGQIGAYTSAF